MVQGAAARNRRLSQDALGNAMALAFYYASGSPYAWRVWLALEHKGIPYERKTLSFDAGDLKTPEFAALNPRRKVPVIVDEGFALYESGAIVEYLEDKRPGEPRLFSADFTLYPYVALVLRMGKRRPDLVTVDLIGPSISAWMRRMEALPVTRKTWPPHWK